MVYGYVGSLGGGKGRGGLGAQQQQWCSAQRWSTEMITSMLRSHRLLHLPGLAAVDCGASSLAAEGRTRAESAVSRRDHCGDRRRLGEETPDFSGRGLLNRNWSLRGVARGRARCKVGCSCGGKERGGC